MKPILFLIVLLAVTFQVIGQTSIPIINEVKADINPLDTLDFDQIVAYNINFDTTTNRRTHFQMSYNADDYDLSLRQSSSKRIVDSVLFDDIIKLFSDTATYGSNYADCFEPRFVLQFRHKAREVFRIIICEGCGFLISTSPIPSAYLKYYDSEFEDEGEQVIYRRYLKGFSASGASQINELCKSLNMRYCANQPGNDVLHNTDLIEADCVKYILARDDSLGRIRNQACKTIPLSETIKQYVRSVNDLNFGNCPPEFKRAFESHMLAWKQMQEFTNQYPEMRGEMHELLDKIEEGENSETFKPILKNIWDTWADVENSQR